MAQPVDTDLNQHVKRLHMALETRALLQKMADGHRVPQLSRHECIDIMVQVLSGLQVHVDAAKRVSSKLGSAVPSMAARTSRSAAKLSIYGTNAGSGKMSTP